MGQSAATILPVSQPVTLSGNPSVVVTPNPLPVTAAVPIAANVLDGFRSDAATTAAATIITIPQGRVWIGYVSIVCAVEEDAAGAVAGQALGILSVSGAGAAPPAGNIVACEAKSGTNAATGTVGAQGNNSMTIRVVLIAPAGNSIALQAASTIAGSTGKVHFMAIGELQ